MAKVAVFFAPGYEEIEALTVVDVLRRAQIQTDMVSVTGEASVCGSHGIDVKMDCVLSGNEAEEYDVCVLPGGMPGTLNLEKNETLMKVLDSFHEKGKLVAAICAAPSILGHRDMLKGKTACCYPGFEDELEGAEVTDEAVIKDGNIITSRAMGCALDFVLEILATLKSPEEADAMADSLLY